MRPPIALLIGGHAGTGKTTLANALIPALNSRANNLGPWCLVDRDVVGRPLVDALLTALGTDPNDRDSPLYRTHVRDLEYRAVLDVAADNLRLGVNVVLPAPFRREFQSGQLSSKDLFPDLTSPVEVKTVWLTGDEAVLRARIAGRARPADRYKLENWAAYWEGLESPSLKSAPDTLFVNTSSDLESQRLVVDEYLTLPAFEEFLP